MIHIQVVLGHLGLLQRGRTASLGIKRHNLELEGHIHYTTQHNLYSAIFLVVFIRALFVDAIIK